MEIVKLEFFIQFLTAAWEMFRRTVLNRFVWGFAGIAVTFTPDLHAAVKFTDITESAGVAMTNVLTESVAWGDYDKDGDPDLYFTNQGKNRLFRNDGNGAFSDVTDIAGVGHLGFGVGTAFGDLDRDGDLDLYVVNFGRGADVLYRNDGPTGTGSQHVFSEVTQAAGISLDRSSRGMTYLDFDQDGLLDIYVNAIGNDILYHNLGDLRFQDVASAVGVVGLGGQGVGVVATDVNNDGRVDLFTGNRSNDPNRLLINAGGTFVDRTTEAGISAQGLGMGVISLDYDNDLDFDLYWTAWPGGNNTANAFYENDGENEPEFTNVTASSGTADVSGWGISANIGDIDQDGWMDMAVTNGFDSRSTPNVLFRNKGNGQFEDITDTLGGGDFDGRGVAFADFDLDGDLDLVITADAGDDTRLWRNDSDTGHHWLGLELLPISGSGDAIGARVEVTTNLTTTVQELRAAAGRGSSNDLMLLFGLGNTEQIDQVIVRWPDGHHQVITGLAADRYHRVTQVPEPATAALMLSSILWMVAHHRSRNTERKETKNERATVQ